MDHSRARSPRSTNHQDWAWSVECGTRILRVIHGRDARATFKVTNYFTTAPERGLDYILWTIRTWTAALQPNEQMNYHDLIKEIVSTYQKHGWKLRRVLLRPETRAEIASHSFKLDDVRVEAALVDGLWFSRPSQEQREAWELRLLAENPFALFETFEVDETEEQREEMRHEMEARLRDYANK